MKPESRKNIIEGLNLTEDEKVAVANCPHEIQDLKKFLLWHKVFVQAQRFASYTTSDKTVLNLRAPSNIFLPRCRNLPEEEKQKILNLRRNFNSLNTKATNLYRSATGSYRGEGANGADPIGTLLSEKKAILLEYFERMFSIDEVLIIMRKDWGASALKKPALVEFFRSNETEINKLRERHRSNFEHLRLSSKTSRLEELSWMYNKIKSRYETGSNREDHKVMLSTIDSIRKEVEGDKLTINGSIELNLQTEINTQIRNELLKSLPLKEIILGRLSARIGISPQELINDLGQSHYAKFNRMISDIEDVDFEEVGLPSLQAYDFDMIERKNREEDKVVEANIKNREVNKEKRVKEEEASEKNKESMKNMLMNKLKDATKRSKEQQAELKNRLIG